MSTRPAGVEYCVQKRRPLRRSAAASKTSGLVAEVRIDRMRADVFGSAEDLIMPIILAILYRINLREERRG